MSTDVVRASGREAQALTTHLLQRARLADPLGGVWEAADVQWWSRRPRASDEVDQLFWLDDEGPVSGVLLTAWPDGWQCDVLAVAGAGPTSEELWSGATGQLDRHARGARVEVPVAAEDTDLRALVEASGFTVGETDSTGWLAAADRPPVRALADGFVVVDRTQRTDVPHPMRARNGDEVAERLALCSLYDPGLDLAVETPDGEVAGYSMYWADLLTGVGLVEPVRVEDAFSRRGLATAMLTAGLDRLARRGVVRMKVSWEAPGPGALYRSLGFLPARETPWYAATWR